MNIIEAVPRMRDGEIMQTNDVSNNLMIRISDGRLQFNAIQNSIDGGWQNIVPTSLWLFSSDFIPYKPKPKSPIEEAIEREVEDAINCECCKIADNDASRTHFTNALRIIVNLTLDEAKKAAVTGNIKFVDLDREALSRIDTLKVKE